MSNQNSLPLDQIVFLVAGAAGIAPVTAGNALMGKRIKPRTRQALVHARGNLDTIKSELSATLDRLAGDSATAMNGGAS